jgi:hypothetical protein
VLELGSIARQIRPIPYPNSRTGLAAEEGLGEGIERLGALELKIVWQRDEDLQARG